MANKTKIKSTVEQAVSDTVASLGIVLMTAATTLGLVEIPSYEDKRALIPAQPAYAYAGQAEQGNAGSEIRRERDEIHPHQLSYGVSQRTPSRTGRM